MSPDALTIEPGAQAYLDALYDRDSQLAERIDAFLDLLEDDPHVPEVHNRAHALQDRNGENFSAASVRTGRDDAMVFWREEADGEKFVVRVIYIGENRLRL